MFTLKGKVHTFGCRHTKLMEVVVCRVKKGAFEESSNSYNCSLITSYNFTPWPITAEIDCRDCDCWLWKLTKIIRYSPHRFHGHEKAFRLN